MEGIVKKWIFVVTVITFWSGSSDAAQLKDYDLLVANGNSIMFFLSSSNVTENISLTTAPANVKDQKTRIKWIASDEQNDMIYFSSVQTNRVKISSHNLITNRTTEIYSTNGTRGVEGLSLYKNYLYWNNKQKRTIMRLEISNLDSNLTSRVPEVVFTDLNSTFESFAIHPLDGSIYYTNWRKGEDAQILVYTGLQNSSMGGGESRVYAKNLSQPYGLYSDSTHLYWIANPPGVYYSIERLNFEDPEKIELLHKSSGRHLFSIAVKCSRTIFFTDVRNKALWKLSLINNNLTMVKYFRDENFPPSDVNLIDRGPLVCEDVQIEKNVEKVTVGQPVCSGLDCDTVTTIDPSKTDAKYNEHQNQRYNIALHTTPKLLVENCTSQENSCLNGVSCLKIDGRIFCLSEGAAVNSRLCAENLTSELPVVSSPSKEHLRNQSSILSSWSSSTDPFLICSAVLSALVILLIIVVVLLLIKVRKLDRKPRIRRRVVVSHRSDIDNNPSSSVCEMIDIENCCNMNVCETPCYERVTGAAVSSTSSGTISFGRSRKNSMKEDKKCLLNS